MLFFFSSRRRHTRFDCDWSSDVCSSDLRNVGVPTCAGTEAAGVKREAWRAQKGRAAEAGAASSTLSRQPTRGFVQELLDVCFDRERICLFDQRQGSVPLLWVGPQQLGQRERYLCDQDGR